MNAEIRFQRQAYRHEMGKFLFLIPLMGILMLLPLRSHSREIVICIPDVNMPPMAFVDHEGVAQRLARNAIERQGDTVRFLIVPLRRCRNGVKNGTYDVGLPAPFNQEALLDFSFPMKNGNVDGDRGFGIYEMVVVRLVGSAANWDGEKFTKVTMPVLSRGAIVVKNKLAELGVNEDSGSKDNQTTLRKLIVRRGEIAIVQKIDAENYLNQEEFRGKLEILPQPFLVFPAFLAFNQMYYTKTKSHVEAIWTEIMRLRASPERIFVARTLDH